MQRISEHTGTLGILDSASGIYVEGYFQEILCRERRRSERTGEPFILMLLQLKGEALRCAACDDIMRKCLDATIASKRETDMCGWFKQGSVIGVLFTGNAEASLAEALETIEDKLKRKLHEALSPAALKQIAVTFQVFPENRERKKTGEPFNLLFYPDIMGSSSARKVSRVVKRVTDIAGSLFGLALFSPFFLAIPILIKLTSNGPVLYRQERYGQYGQKFIFYKFRSMYTDNDDAIHREYVRRLITEMKDSDNADSPEVIYKIKDDPRVTPIGRFLRKSSLDELPQFVNVLRGDMSLVGPRPPIPYELEDYHTWHRQRLLGEKPGITGLWQVKGRSLTTFDGMVRLDLQYIRTRSLWLDLKLILATPMAMFRGKGAY